ncbi:MAG: hypothetical protein JWM25_1354, partial [Thermoleophilia bacterium]|nr:hypothetical protein [Thermoleophilia bacterium]
MPPETAQPLVSIQIPTYNRPEYLALSLRSAIEQTYENLEILVSDDASPNREVEAVVREVAAGDPRVRYVRQPENLGNIANFVWALRASRGEYCKALCDDDLIAPTHVERLLAPMVDDPRISFAFSYFQHIDAHGRVQPDPPGYGRWAQSPKLLPGAEFAQAGMPANMNLVGSTTATLFPRRRLALPHLGRFGGVAVSHYGADWSIWLGLLASGPAFYSPEPLSQTREHEGRVTHDARHIYDRVNDLLVIQEQFASFAPDIDRVAKMSALNMITGIAMQSATAHADTPDAARVLDVAERALGHVRRLQAGGA